MKKDRRINPDDDAREVLEAIRRGHSTFNDIWRATKCTAERLSEALAHLLLTGESITTEQRNGVRHFIPATGPAPKPPTRDPRSEPAPALSFSTLSGLMQARPTVRVSEARK